MSHFRLSFQESCCQKAAFLNLMWWLNVTSMPHVPNHIASSSVKSTYVVILYLAKCLCLYDHPLQSYAAMECRIYLCCLWLCVTISFHSGLLHPLLPNSSFLCLEMGGIPLLLSPIPTSSCPMPSPFLPPGPLHTAELPVKWARPSLGLLQTQIQFQSILQSSSAVWWY